MISITQYTRVCKGGIWIITGMEDVPCPCCGGNLGVRNTCSRTVVLPDDSREHLQLRVMKCGECGRTHRELPAGIVPYKRHSAESICKMKEDSDGSTKKDSDECIPEITVRRRILFWLDWFLAYAEDIARSIRERGFPVPEQPGNTLLGRLTYFVRLVVNTHNWIQHCSVVQSASDSAIIGSA